MYTCSSCVQLIATPWTVACQVPLRMEFSSRNSGMGCHFLLPGIFSTQGSKQHFLNRLHLQADSLPLVLPGKSPNGVLLINNAVIISGEQQKDSTRHIHIFILPQTPLPSRLPSSIKQSSLCYVVGSRWLSVLNIAVGTWPAQTPNYPAPSSFPLATMFVL